MLPAAKQTLTGSYFAEQVAAASYDLVCIAHADSMNRPSTQHGFGGGSSSSRPATQGGPRRRQVCGGKVQCTELPSLNSIELLLDPGGAEAGTRSAQMERDAQEELRSRRSLRLRKISARLCRGEVAKGWSEELSTPNDMEVLAALTQPLPFFTKQLPISSCNSSQTRLRPRGSVEGHHEGHRTYHDAVAAGLVGTDLKMRRPRKARAVSPGRRTPKKHTASAQSLRSNHSVKSLEIIDVPVPPLLAEAYLMSEALAAGDEDKDSQMARIEGKRFSVMQQQKTPLAGSRAPTQDFDNAPVRNEDSSNPQRGKASQATMLPPTAMAVPIIESPGTPTSSENLAGRQFTGEIEVKEPDVKEPEVKEAKVAIGEVAWETNDQEKSDPNSSVLESLTATSKMGAHRREAAQSLRIFIFGCIDSNKKGLSPKEIDRVLREKPVKESCSCKGASCKVCEGARSQVQLLHAFWTKLDSDRSGSVDVKEFKGFVDLAMKDIQEGTSRVRGGFSMAAFKDGTPEENANFARQLIDRVGHVLLGRKVTVVIEDVMRIIWPCSRNVDLKVMKGWVNELELSSWRREPPKQLAKDEFDGLAAVFKFFDKDASGTVTVEELVLSGFLDKDQAFQYVQEVDESGDGELSMLEFCELFCPTGYRAHGKAKVGTDESGRRLVFDDRMNGWRLEEMDPGKAGLFS